MGGLNPGEVLVGELVEHGPGHAGGLAVIEADERAERDRHLSDSAWQRIVNAVPKNTKRAYARVLRGVTGEDEPSAAKGRIPWQHMAWEPWCATSGRTAGNGDQPATRETFAQWASDLIDNGIGVPALEQAVAAVQRYHRAYGHRGHPDPEHVEAVLTDHRAGTGHTPDQVAPVTLPILAAMLDTCDRDTVKGRRDAAMLVTGLAGMFRRSEIAALDLSRMRESAEGLVYRLPKSKTDRRARGVEVVIPRSRRSGSPTDPVALALAVRADLAEQGITEGPLFRSVDRYGTYRGPLDPNGYDVARVIKGRISLAGLDPHPYSGHSLRAGGATAAYLKSATIREIMDQGRWKSPGQVLEYIRRVDRWTDNAAAKLDL